MGIIINKGTLLVLIPDLCSMVLWNISKFDVSVSERFLTTITDN